MGFFSSSLSRRCNLECGFVFPGNAEVAKCVLYLDRGYQVRTGKMCLVQPITICRMRRFSVFLNAE